MADICAKINLLREYMAHSGADYYLLDDADEHGSEYTNDSYKLRTCFSGFDGSNGKLLIGREDAYLWTDGRYFIQAANQLEGTGITLMKMGEADVPSLSDFIGKRIPDKSTVMYNPFVLPKLLFSRFEKSISSDRNITFKPDEGYSIPFAVLEKLGAPTVSLLPGKVSVLSNDLCGMRTSEKLSVIREKLAEKNYDAVINADLSINMYIFNVRGCDIVHNPVAFSYSYVSKSEAVLYLYKEVINDEILKYAEEEGFKVLFYENAAEDIARKVRGLKVCIDEGSANTGICQKIEANAMSVQDDDCGIFRMMAVRTEKEIENIRKVYEKDSCVLASFLREMKKNPCATESEARIKLDSLRLADSDCFDLSFDTISAYGPNGAMMHYEDSEDRPVEIKPGNLYLVDSGGQWLGGTTDVTRTIAIGDATYEMKHDYTRVVRGMLALQNAVFMKGCTGINLDILARAPMWEEGDDYKCGTGHGIGYMLSVHEGPHAIRWKANVSGKDAVLEPGMLVSDEPGIYKEGKYGIRMENILLVKEKCTTADGVFLCFECLTKVPVDEDLILREEMSVKELEWLDAYQTEVSHVLR